MTLYIIRHGETDLNRQGIVQGSGVDSDLNHIGRQQARLFYEYYKHVPFDHIVTSALRRTHQTVEPFLSQNQHNWLAFKELNEISWGVHEGRKSDELTHLSYKKLMSDWESGVYDTRLDGGESAAELHQRVTHVLQHLQQPAFDRKNVLMCTHGRTLMCLLTILKNEPLSNMNQYKHQNTCLYKVHRIDQEYIFELENDVTHLGNLKTVHF